MVAQVLRAYQEKAIQDLRQVFREGKRSAVLVAPTGAGKTTIAAQIILNAIANGRRVVFLAHRKELIDQCSTRLDDQGLDHGVIKAGHKRRNNRPVQIASLMTLVNRVKPKDGQQGLIPFKPPSDLFIIDECHRATAKTYKEILTLYPDAILLGLTATPCRTDGRGLGELFQAMVQASTPAELTELGYLVPARVFTTPLIPDFSKTKQKKGDFDQAEVDKVVDKPKLIGDIYGHWKRLASDRKTVVFANSRRHGLNITADFVAKGERAEYIDGTTHEREREAVLKRLLRGETQVVVNVGILTEGWDNPEISCVVLARPTKSLVLFLQMAGRALRTAEWVGKVDCLLLDHGGNTLRHGFVTDEREWDLAGKKGGRVSVESVTTCKKCFAVFASKAVCPECGVETKDKAKAEAAAAEQIKHEEGELHEVDVKAQRAEEISYFQQQLKMQEERGYKPNYARVTFFQKYGRWPGKEIGIKKTWEITTDEQGNKKFKLAGWDFKPGSKLDAGKAVHAREGAANGHPENLRRAS